MGDHTVAWRIAVRNSGRGPDSTGTAGQQGDREGGTDTAGGTWAV